MKVWLALGLVAATYLCALAAGQDTFHPTIPKVWDDAEISTMELPLAPPAPETTQVTAAYYYSIPTLTIYKSYPVYPAGKEPPGYMEGLKQQEPQLAFDSSKLRTEMDWISAGALVFQTSIIYAPAPIMPLADPVRYARYYVREKGKVEWGADSCAQCHMRTLTDGTVVYGAQSDRPLRGGAPISIRPESSPPGVPILLGGPAIADSVRRLYSTPWFTPDPNLGPSINSNTPGASGRPGTAHNFPTQIPDLIGLKDRKYFDHTGLHQHRSIADVMRYAALANSLGMERLRRYGDFLPFGANYRELPDSKTLVRFSDEQLYALALYLYSLQPPPNPNEPDEVSAAGEKIFRREGCVTCHTPPLYTNNKLIPVDGFQVPLEHREKYDILNARIGLDPFLALKTRRGTGYYKVPSLKGVWYRGPFEHHGSVMRLEDWLDPNRLSDNYVPTGYRGLKGTRAVQGHPFGLKLSPEDKKALIAFLKTL